MYDILELSIICNYQESEMLGFIIGVLFVVCILVGPIGWAIIAIALVGSGLYCWLAWEFIKKFH